MQVNFHKPLFSDFEKKEKITVSQKTLTQSTVVLQMILNSQGDQALLLASIASKLSNLEELDIDEALFKRIYKIIDNSHLSNIWIKAQILESLTEAVK